MCSGLTCRGSAPAWVALLRRLPPPPPGAWRLGVTGSDTALRAASCPGTPPRPRDFWWLKRGGMHCSIAVMESALQKAGYQPQWPPLASRSGLSVTWRDASQSAVAFIINLCLLLLYRADTYDGLEAVRHLPMNSSCSRENVGMECGLTCGHLRRGTARWTSASTGRAGCCAACSQYSKSACLRQDALVMGLSRRSSVSCCPG